MNVLWFEMRLAWRSLWRSPGFALSAIGILTAGLALALYAFGALASIVLRPLPFPEPERLVHLELTATGSGATAEVSRHDFLDLRRMQTSLESLQGFYQGTVNLSGDFRPERHDGAFVSAGGFEALGVQPHLGRTFATEPGQGERLDTVLIGYTLWQQRFGGDAAVIGREIRANGRPRTIIGVMPPGFRFPYNNQIWLPLDTDVADLPRGSGVGLEVYGRLREGVTRGQAAEEFDALIERLVAEYPEAARGDRAVVKPYRDEFLSAFTRRIALTMAAAGLLVLLVACANIANLMLARGAARAHDVAIRGALGASRGRLVGSVMMESTLLVCLALPLAYLVATAAGEATMAAVRASSDPPPYWMTRWQSDAFTVSAALAIGALTAIVAGIVPGLRMAGRGAAGFRGARGGIGRLGRALVVAEVALSLALVVAGALVVRGTLELNQLDIGTRTEDILTARLGLFDTVYPEEGDVQLFHRRLLTELESRPGIDDAALTSAVPLADPGGTWLVPEHLQLADPARTPAAQYVAATPGYFSTFGVQALSGRVFDAGDDADGRPVALISASLAERLWAGEEPVGSRLRLARAGDDEAPWLTVVGVVADVVYERFELDTDAVYVPLAQRPSRFVTVAVAASGSAASAFDTLSSAVSALDADLPLYWVRSMEQWLDLAAFDHRLLARIFAVLGVFALVLAMAGLYAVLAFSVSQRTREIGVRRALGATDGRIAGTVVRQGLAQTVLGIVLGTVLAWGFARALSGVLFGIDGLDSASVAAVVAMFIVTAAAAALVPTLRALRVEPVTALRYE
jgi:predicted permease